ncbi:MAG: glycosyltransferase [Ignavibacteriota bacterium]
MDISIVIVNYNVREFLRGALESVRRSLAFGGLTGEIFVVDNDSRDGSAEMVRTEFPEVILHALGENLGFGKANNLAMRQARGDYFLILNPDTILGEDTLRVMVDFMKSHPQAGVSGCKLLNADGSFQISCRRGFPTPWASFTKLFGLSSFFPNSPRFAQYNLTYLPVDKTYEIDALAGAFMLLSREAFVRSGGFDEDYFMYGEDIDLCYRIKKSGLGVWYVHETSTVHFKGESTRRSVLNEVKVFYEAMHIFVQKHYGKNPVFTILLRFGIMARSLIAIIKKYRGAITLGFADAVAITVSILLLSRFTFGAFFGLPAIDYPWVFIIPVAVLLVVLSIIGGYQPENRRRSKMIILSMPVSLIVLSSLTYFFKEFASSRSLVLMITVTTAASLICVRLFFRFIDRIRFGGEGTARPVLRRTLIAGTGPEALRIASLLLSSGFTKRYYLIGFIDKDLTRIDRTLIADIPIKGDLKMLAKVIRDQHVSQVIFPSDAFTYSEMLGAMQQVSAEGTSREVSFNVVPQASDVLLSRSKIELIGAASSESLALMPLQYNVQKMSHRIVKRVLDLVVAVVAYPLVWLANKVSRSTDRTNLLHDLGRVLVGSRSLVGLSRSTNEGTKLAKIGVVSLADITGYHGAGKLRPEDVDQMNIYYARHHTIGMDIEILLRKLFSRG